MDFLLFIIRYRKGGIILRRDFSEKKRVFSKVYAETGGDLKKASQAVGYKESYGKRLLKDEDVKMFIEKFKTEEKSSEKSKVGRDVAESDEILKFLTGVMRGSNENIEGSIRERMSAADLLSKRKQPAEDNTDEGVNVVIIDDIK